MIEISTEALELNAGRDFLYVQLTKCAEPDTKGCEEDPENYSLRLANVYKRNGDRKNDKLTGARRIWLIISARHS